MIPDSPGANCDKVFAFFSTADVKIGFIYNESK